MFGYIQPIKDELKVRQHNAYKGVYCGLCKTMRTECSNASRFSLQYDIATLAFLLCDLQGVEIEYSMKNCMLHPIKRRMTAKSNYILRYCAHINNVLSYNKLKDMWQDEKALYAPVGMLALKKGYKKSQRLFKSLDEDISKALSSLKEYEDRDEECFDYPALATGELMAAIADNCPKINEFNKKALSNMLLNLGIWIYLADATEDIERDIKKNNYNPLLKDNKVKEDILAQVEQVMTFALVQAKKALDLLELNDSNDLMNNILYMALPDRMDRIFNKINEETANEQD